MKKILSITTIIFLLLVSACTKDKLEPFVFIEGGAFVNSNSRYHDESMKLPGFYMGRYEVTQKEWTDIMGNNPSTFKGDSLPVETVSWYDCIEYCNKRSEREDLQPYYVIDKNKKDPTNKNENDTVKWSISINANSNGYRLPTEAEWEYAASGGQKSKNYIYSGSNKVDKVAWFWKNSGKKKLDGEWNWNILQSNLNQPHLAKSKKANELGLYNMSGNVREWCWDWYEDSDHTGNNTKVWKGGGWIGDSACCEISYRGKLEANGLGPDQGFRICRNE